MSEEFKIFDNRDKNKKVEASVFIATYNQQWCIGHILDALMSQSVDNFEILVADDGSSDKTHEIVKKYPVFLITQEDKGFRKTRIANEASKYVKSPYIILLDADCIPHRDYVKSHIEMREKGFYLAGRRIDVPQDLSEGFLKSSSKTSMQKYLLSHFWKVKKVNRLIPWRNPLLRKLFKQDQIPDMMGCNASFWYDDFVAVDGYDERYVKAHREDGDLCVRFQNLGLKIKSVKGLALIYHLWHVQQPYYENEDLFEETIREKRIKAVKGISSR